MIGACGAPLLRLAAQSIYTDDSGPVAEYSAGLYVAVGCNDYPQAFDMRPRRRPGGRSTPPRSPPCPTTPSRRSPSRSG
jgi:hypothetical protein